IDSLRNQLGVVPQEPFLFHGTIRDNIAFAHRSATTEEINTAIDHVGLTEAVQQLPDGIDTLVHERGVSLSAGERQLLALARAFISRPRVIVLDEATSSLDLRSEAQIEQALESLLEGRTAVLIAHRLATAMKADRIGVVDAGTIIELGTHEELVGLGGRYAEMFETWMSHVESDTSAESAPLSD
ncbi:MAG TPA: ATP-binding cassette domain-containing protein, partial [Acidimicrobiales bacterium]|nr:ATP-binding cassette domain-containing protein [Acidimicrobiales bacterium]